MKFFKVLILSFLIITTCIKAQDPVVDSLKKALSIEKNDTTKLDILETLIENIYDDRVWPVYNEQLFKLSSTLIDNRNEQISARAKEALASSYNNTAGGYITAGDLANGLLYIEKSSKLFTEINNKQGYSNCLTYLGIIYNDKGDIPKALDFYD